MVSRYSGEFRGGPGGELVRLLQEELQARVSPQDFETWVARSPCAFVPPDRFVVTTTNRFRKAWMEKNLRESYRTAARAVFDFEARIDFELVQPSAGSNPAPAQCPAPVASPSSPGDSTHVPPAPAGSATRVGAPPLPRHLTRKDLNSQYTFDTFVQGASNSVALAAAVAICDQPASTYNPLFIYGGHGTGKTHLLQAVCQRLIALRRSRVLYLSAEEFLNRFVTAVAEGNTGSLRGSWKETDTLVLDDIHCLSGKERTQEELFHVLNDLIDHNKQVVLASRMAPRAAPLFSSRLISRFQWGLVARIEPADFELRVAILLRKAHSRGLELPVELAELIASRTHRTTRELEGTLTQIASTCSVLHRPVEASIVHGVLQSLELGGPDSAAVTIAEILEAVQRYYQLKPRELLARTKTRSIVLPRQVGMFLAREMTQLSLDEIGMHFGGRDHTTVLYAQERIEALQRSSVQVRSDLQALRGLLGSDRSR